MLKNKGGFITMLLSVLGVVLYISIFPSILSALETIRIYANIATFIALETIVEIAPTILLLTGVGLGAFGVWKGSSVAAGQDPGGLMRIVMGALLVILFATLFSTILTSFYLLYTANNASAYTAFQTVVTILPTILFLGGIFAGGYQAVSGYKARKRSGRKVFSFAR